MHTTYHGSCHCGAIAFEADIDLGSGASRCNCTLCRKMRNWSARVAPGDFRLLRGEEKLGLYDASGKGYLFHGFCSHCGIRLFSRGDLAELGGAFVTVSLPALDDATPEALIAAPLTWCDGLNNNWWNPPVETRHL